MDNILQEFEHNIGYEFKNRSYLVNALTHTSYVNENRDAAPKDNERLEFFGDAIIEFCVSEYLYNNCSDLPEGEMTRVRASMVCEPSLALCAKEIDLGSFLYMGKGEELSGGRERKSITSDAFEAVVAAIYLDGGMEPAKEFIYKHLLSSLKDENLFYDAKTRLQEMAQKNGDNVLTYEMISESGPAHNRTFEVAVFLNGKEIGRGTGRSKKSAQQNAAHKAISTGF